MSISCITLSFFCFTAALGQGPAQAGARERGAARAEAGAVSIVFPERKLGEPDRTPEGLLKALLGASATLKTERPIRYRSSVLPPGTYPVAVVVEEERSVGRNLFFVIGPAAGAGEGKNGRTPEEKKLEGSEARQAGRATGDPLKDGPAGRPLGRAMGKPGERAAGGAAPGVLRALFHLAPAAKAAEGIEFAVRPTARGDRFTLTVRAGGSQGKATLRFADLARQAPAARPEAPRG